MRWQGDSWPGGQCCGPLRTTSAPAQPAPTSRGFDHQCMASFFSSLACTAPGTLDAYTLSRPAKWLYLYKTAHLYDALQTRCGRAPQVGVTLVSGYRLREVLDGVDSALLYCRTAAFWLDVLAVVPFVYLVGTVKRSVRKRATLKMTSR